VTSNLTVKIGADIDGLKRELAKATSSLNGFNSKMAGVGKMIAGAFTVGAVIGIGKAIFNTTAEFEKFNAVLTNTFGNAAAAKAVMSDITTFAAKTPFQVDELTQSFVKLANQGFVPTMAEMTKLGDLAASQGKSFNQLTEAIIDAQTGEFERLKEFGVRASKQGDKVMFTFKGVKTQVDFTNASIRDYVLSLGEAEGVTGGMDAISKTMGGGLSNLTDAFTQLAAAIGNAANNGGFLSKVLDGIARGVKGLTSVFAEPEIFDYVKATRELKELRMQAAAAGDMDKWSEYNNLIQQGTEKIREWAEGQKKLDDLRNKGSEQAIKNIKKEKQAKDEVTDPGQRKRFGLDTSVGLFEIRNIRAELMKEMPAPKTDALKRFAFDFNQVAASIKIPAASIGQTLNQVSIDIDTVNEIINTGLQNMAFTIGEGIGNALAGVGKMSDLGPMLLGALGGVLVQLGQMAIQAGLGVEAIKKALQSMNGVVAVAAGIALVALGTAVSAKSRSLGRGMGSGGGSSSGGSSASVSNSFQKAMTEAQDSNPTLTAVIKNKDLHVILENYKNDSQSRKMTATGG
jgi:uncharacterized protein YwgA